MPWMREQEIAEIAHVDQIRASIFEGDGTLDPVPNIQALNYVTHYYARNMERLGRYEALQREIFANLLMSSKNPMTIGKAEALSKGSDYGMRRAFYEKMTAGYLELINTLKKTHEFHTQSIKNVH